MLELKWDQVDLETLVIHLDPEGRPQTTKKRVPISDALQVMLERAHSERQTDYVLDRPSKLDDQLAEGGFAKVRSTSSTLQPSTLEILKTDTFRRAIQVAAVCRKTWYLLRRGGADLGWF